MTAAVTNFQNLFSGLPLASRRIVLRREVAATTYGGVAAKLAKRLWFRMTASFSALSGESRVIWSMSGVATLGFVVLVSGGGTP